MKYITGNTIKELREKNHFTQKQLADMLNLSDKTISKWETNRGLPDISVIADLAQALNVSVAELLLGEYIENENRAGNMKKTRFYVCPICGNVIQAVGEGAFSCCGIQLPALEPEENNDGHQMQVEVIDNEYYITVDHEMKKEHYISFFAYVTSGRAELVKMYPEQNPEARFAKKGHGFLYAYCNKHGLYKKMI